MSNLFGSNGNGMNRITTLFVRPSVGELSRDEILNHFSAFGDVKSVRICNKPTGPYGFVEFTQAEAAVKALETKTIAGRKVKVAVADDNHREKPSLLELNDDCIDEILSAECLSAMDLCSVAETGGRLNGIAGRVFRTKHKTCDLNELSQNKATSAHRIMKNFGSVVTHLRINGYRWRAANEMLDSLAKCSNTLESLCLRYFDVPENFAAKLMPLFNNLQKLSIRGCTFNGASKKLFAHCGSLVELEVFDGDFEFIAEKTFPKLERFVYTPSSHVLPDIWDPFIVRHPNLKSLKIWGHIKSSSLQPIADNCERLEELQFRIRPDDTTTLDLSNFGHLRKLEIDCDERNVIKEVQGWNNLNLLESLTLVSAEIDSEFIQTLSQLKWLQVLRLHYCTGLQNWNQIGELNQLTKLEIWPHYDKVIDFDLVLLVKRLRNLKDLSVPRFRMDRETYSGIVDVVRARPDKSKLSFQLSGLHRRDYDDMRHDFARNAHIVEMLNWD